MKRPLKTLTYVIAGVAYFSGYLFAATDSAKTKSPAGTPAATSGGHAGHGTGAGTAAGAGTATGAAGQPSQAAMTLTDAQILGVVNAVDEHEIDAATKAMKQQMSTEAAGYAKMLKEQHAANKELTAKLAKSLKLKPASSPVADSLRAEGKKSGKALSAKKGPDYEKGYIEAMVNGHTEVLRILDTELMPNAKEEAVKSHLTEVRGHVSAHLEQGKRLQGGSASVTE